MKTGDTMRFWTEERVAELQRLWADGLSARAIMEQIGCDSRSAVLGKIHRLKLSGTGPQARKIQPKAPRPAKRSAPARLVFPSGKEPLELPAEEAENAVTLFDLREHHCRWPVSGNGADTLFCGTEKIDDRSYCARHCQMAFRAPTAA